MSDKPKIPFHPVFNPSIRATLDAVTKPSPEMRIAELERQLKQNGDIAEENIRALRAQLAQREAVGLTPGRLRFMLRTLNEMDNCGNEIRAGVMCHMEQPCDSCQDKLAELMAIAEKALAQSTPADGEK